MLVERLKVFIMFICNACFLSFNNYLKEIITKFHESCNHSYSGV